jgi:hypothetical protein
MGNVSFNPALTTGFANTFELQTGGFVQGTFLDDPAARFQLEGGFVGSGQSTPLWGGLPVTLAVPAPGSEALGPAIIAAVSLVTINAWTLFNQAAAGIITPGSNVPLYSSGTSINFARPGSNLRIVLPVNPADVNALEGAAPNVALYWDATNLRLDTSSSSNYGPLPVQLEFLSTTSKTVNYASGLANWVNNGSVAVVRI